jgi:hypothetical protein
MNPDRDRVIPLREKPSKVPAIILASCVGLATLISAESHREFARVCPEIIQRCRTDEKDATRYPVRQEVKDCIVREINRVSPGITSQILLATCGQEGGQE